MIFKIGAMAFIAATMAVLLKQSRPEISMQIGVLAGLLILLSVMEQLAGVVSGIVDAAASYGLDGPYLSAVFKVIGIAYAAQFAAEACRDSGEVGLASKVELAARVVMLTIALPVVLSLLESIGALLEVNG